MDVMPRVSIIILNWNGWEDTIECLESVYQITYPNYDVIVVDNGSENESVEKIKEYASGNLPTQSSFFKYSWESKPIDVLEYSREEFESEIRDERYNLSASSNKRLILIKNGKNFGFTEGNNIAMRYALKTLTPDYILLLNNDTVVDKNFVGGLVLVANQSNQTGVVGPVVFHYDQPAQLQESAGRICMWTGRRSFIHSTDSYNSTDFAINVDFVSGVCFLVHTEVVKKVGMFDPEYFAYVEDVDWCYRICQKGYHVIYTNKAKIWHKGSSSTGGGYNRTVMYYIFRNNLLFMRKNGKLRHLPSYIVVSGLYFAIRLLKTIFDQPQNVVIILKGIVSGLRSKT